MASVIYKEKQQFGDWFVVALLSLAAAGLFWGAIGYLREPDQDWLRIIVNTVLAGGLAYAIYWLVTLRSKLTITDKKIKFKLKGRTSFKDKIAWEDVTSCTFVKAIGPVKWTRPKAVLNSERYYSLTGRNGLLIHTEDGEQYFIGVEDLKQLREALNNDAIPVEIKEVK